MSHSNSDKEMEMTYRRFLQINIEEIVDSIHLQIEEYIIPLLARAVFSFGVVELITVKSSTKLQALELIMHLERRGFSAFSTFMYIIKLRNPPLFKQLYHLHKDFLDTCSQDII
jgi:hypothetical protein